MGPGEGGCVAIVLKKIMPNVVKCVYLCYTFLMKLSQYAKQQGISYRTALRWFRSGTIKGYQAPSGTIIVLDEEPHPAGEVLSRLKTGSFYAGCPTLASSTLKDVDCRIDIAV